MLDEFICPRVTPAGFRWVPVMDATGIVEPCGDGNIGFGVERMVVTPSSPNGAFWPVFCKVLEPPNGVSV